ncbi:unnamed protein product [Fraxinus pennsylvanica]|uniref:Phospholipase/carboxylesterase/thioesterase domain-containing protein n=1 Tax=Fraxinus pennsylvanica TaxID=56036 RepID=A0AAD2DX50_9LAMI|nr:unnamed protein product [Fraxinus pennsylvanica]
MGAAIALYSATCFTQGKYDNGSPYPTNLSEVVGLSGWLPCAKNLSSKLEGVNEATSRAASLPILLCHGKVKLGVGGFSMGTAIALYSATCFTQGKYDNGSPYPTNLSAVVGLSGWLPCAKNLSSKLEGVNEATSRAASLPILLCHGKGDDVVSHKFGEKSANKLSSSGFQDTTFKSYSGLGHYTIPEEMNELCAANFET